MSHHKKLRRNRVTFEHRLILLTLLAGLPATIVACWLFWVSDISLQTRIVLTVVLIVWWLGFAFAVRHRVRFPFANVSQSFGGMREGDFSTRARGPSRDDALGELVSEVNTLADTLREQRLGAMEATSCCAP